MFKEIKENPLKCEQETKRFRSNQSDWGKNQMILPDIKNIFLLGFRK